MPIKPVKEESPSCNQTSVNVPRLSYLDIGPDSDWWQSMPPNLIKKYGPHITEFLYNEYCALPHPEHARFQPVDVVKYRADLARQYEQLAVTLPIANTAAPVFDMTPVTSLLQELLVTQKTLVLQNVKSGSQSDNQSLVTPTSSPSPTFATKEEQSPSQSINQSNDKQSNKAGVAKFVQSLQCLEEKPINPATNVPSQPFKKLHPSIDLKHQIQRKKAALDAKPTRKKRPAAVKAKQSKTKRVRRSADSDDECLDPQSNIAPVTDDGYEDTDEEDAEMANSESEAE